jgi:uncharacterized protein
MEQDVKPVRVEPAGSITASERIQALDVVRGFALIGIFLMNIEFFNRATSAIGQGMPAGLTGLDWFASWFVAYFVQGKFWTIFSLLFGMGFAVMLTRAERAERDFLSPYLRRILALAVFGAAHYIFLWSGDILFSYAVAAGALLILLYGKWKSILIAMAVLIGVGFIPQFDAVWGIAGGLAFVGFVALYLRNEHRLNIRGHSVPLFALILLIVGTVAAIAAVVFWVLPAGPKEPRIPVTIMSIVMLVLGVLSAKFHDPVKLRGIRLGVTLYIFSFSMMTIFGAVQYLTPPEPDAPITKVAETAPVKTIVNAGDKTEAPKTGASEAKAMDKADAKATDRTDAKTDKDADKKPKKTDAEKAAERKIENAKRLARRQEETRNEVHVLSQGSYAEAVEMRARKFPGKAAGDAGFATVLIGMFLIGFWFVRSGVMENTAAHLPLFRKLACYALPLGIGLGLVGSFIAVSHTPGDDRDGFQLAMGLQMLGNLPACLGYVGLVVLMLHSNSVFAKISLLAPLGRMALTNYLMQSLICSLYFYAYGLGQWGMPRAWQMVFVAVVFSLQIVFSHWWLARYRYGPMEWLWRAFTYRQTPAMRL